MSEQPSAPSRRPPAPPPALPQFEQRPAPPDSRQSAAPRGRQQPDVPIQSEGDRLRATGGQKPTHRQPPWPRLLRDSDVILEGAHAPADKPEYTAASKNYAWLGTLGWAWIVFVLLLVVAPSDAMGKLVGPFKTPVSASAYGPLMAMFAIGAIVLAVSACLWWWIALGRAREDEPPTFPR